MSTQRRAKNGLTQAMVAGHLDLNPRRLRELIDQNVIPQPRNADLDACRVAYIRYLRERASGRGDGTVSLVEERVRLTQAQTREKTLQVAELEGELVRRDETVAEWSERIRACRARVRAIPRGAMTRVPGFTRAMAKPLLLLIDEALRELSGDTATDLERKPKASRRRVAGSRS